MKNKIKCKWIILSVPFLYCKHYSIHQLTPSKLLNFMTSFSFIDIYICKNIKINPLSVKQNLVFPPCFYQIIYISNFICKYDINGGEQGGLISTGVWDCKMRCEQVRRKLIFLSQVFK